MKNPRYEKKPYPTRGLPLEERIARRTKSVPGNLETPCTVWTGAVNNNGYGQLWIDGKIKLVHRVVCELANGPIPSHLETRHKCTTKQCFRLSHLELGTQSENYRDRERDGTHVNTQGSKHASAKLTELDVRWIRSFHAAGRWTQQNLADWFCVSDVTINRIVNRKSWAHV